MFDESCNNFFHSKKRVVSFIEVFEVVAVNCVPVYELILLHLFVNNFAFYFAPIDMCFVHTLEYRLCILQMRGMIFRSFFGFKNDIILMKVEQVK